MSLAIPIGLDNTVERPGERAPLVLGDSTYHTVTEAVCRIAEQPPTRAWIMGFMVAASLASWFGICIGWLFYTGVGVWGNMSPVFWGWPIVNFVFWVGIGHAGTLISRDFVSVPAELANQYQPCRRSDDDFCGDLCAGRFPGIHVGRAWLAFWLAPYPSLNLWMWPQFRSPLLWDVFAVSTYCYGFAVVLVHGDDARLGDIPRSHPRTSGGGWPTACCRSGWTGSSRHWMRYEKAYAILAALATPLVLSVHTIVSFDFAVSQVPGWHTTIFPPYFVAGAIFSGFAMVLTLMVPVRAIYRSERSDHAAALGEHVQDHSGDRLDGRIGVRDRVFYRLVQRQVAYEQFAFINRAFGPYWWAYWTMVTCNVISPQLFWFSEVPHQRPGSCVIVRSS